MMKEPELHKPGRHWRKTESIASKQRFGKGNTIKALRIEDLFVPIYGAGDFPWALPLHMPPYLMEILWATSCVLYALTRKHLNG